MKRHTYPLLALLTLAGFSSCQKVIDLKLRDADPKLVVQANISNKPGRQIVILSKSTSYYDIVPQQFVPGATVLITDNKGNSYPFSEIKTGVYTNVGLIGVPGTTYFLSVTAEGKSYTSTCRMPDTAKVDSVSYEQRQRFRPGGNSDKPEYRIFCNFTDPKGEGNFYRFLLLVKHVKPSTDNNNNNNLNDGYQLFDDRLTDSKPVQYALRGDFAEPGDTAYVELHTLDKAAYEYYTLMNILLDQGREDASPANPTSNISGGALGYFSAYSAVNRVRITTKLP